MKQYFFLSMFAMALLSSCGGSDDNPDVVKNNHVPTCSITNPQSGQVFSSDESVPVTVVAEDTDGTIAEVQLYIDNVGYSLKEVFPYNFVINAGELAPGSHTLKAVAKDNEGAKAESSITITVQQPNTESPDFVTFADGKIPNTWHTTLWYVDNSLGYDDIYSLRTTESNTAVVTSKTCNSSINFIEFYLKGNGTVDFYVDGSKRKVCSLTNSWVKHGFYFEEGLHTFKWEFSGKEVNLDAIRFKKETQISIGCYYQGGIIAYLDNSGQHGLIAAPEDQSTGIQWYNGSDIVTGASGTTIGAGQNNTNIIVAAQGNGFYAAKLCDDLILNDYNDWFLPSEDELNTLYQNRNLIGGFEANYYWSSSENRNDLAWGQNFSTGTQYSYDYYKSYRCRVRAVRAF